MRASGRGSWRGSVSSGVTLPHRALFIRDSCKLPVRPHPANPPRLLGEVTDHSAGLSTDLLTDAGSEWLSWWHDVITFQVREERIGSFTGGDSKERIRSDYTAYQALFDWPALSALQSKPALRLAAQLSLDDALRFRNAAKPVPQLGRVPRPIAVDLAPIAEALIERRAISPDQLDAAIVVLAVGGDWSYRPAPGVLLCSIATAQDAGKIAPLIEATFLSGVDAA